MRIILYPNYPIDCDSGPVGRFLKRLSKKRPRLWTLVRETFQKVERSINLDFLEDTERVSRIRHIKTPLYEFKLPPKKKKDGVVRLYFGYKDSNTIIILSAELKQGTVSSNDEKIKQAEQRYKEIIK